MMIDILEKYWVFCTKYQSDIPWNINSDILSDVLKTNIG